MPRSPSSCQAIRFHGMRKLRDSRRARADQGNLAQYFTMVALPSPFQLEGFATLKTSTTPSIT
jgi:hypothetical protein